MATVAPPIQKNGTDFVSRNSWNLLASDDEWTSPIVAEVGPDGCMWVVDWYNFIVQHNPIPPGFEKGKGNAYITPLRDKRHGRVYKLIWTKGEPAKAPSAEAPAVFNPPVRPMTGDTLAN